MSKRQGQRRRGARTRSLILPVALLMPLGAAMAAPVSGKVFKVANYPVDASAKDAVTAKEKAHAEGQQAAFRALLKRIVPVTAYNSLTRLKQVNGAELVEGIAVRSERNSSTQYIASLDFGFTADGVRDLLRREGIPFVDTQAAAVTLVAAVVDGAGAASPRTQNLWMTAISGLDLDNTVSPAKVEPLKPVIHADTLRQALSGDSNGWRIFATEYGNDATVLAHAEVETAAKRLHVTLSGYDAVGPLLLKRTYRIADGDLAYTMELAAVIALGTLEGRWKAANAQARGGVDMMTGPGVPVALRIEFAGLSQWNDIRQQLLEIPGVEDVRVDSVSARSAEVSLSFPGGGPQLAAALAPLGMNLRTVDGAWLLGSNE